VNADKTSTKRQWLAFALAPMTPTLYFLLLFELSPQLNVSNQSELLVLFFSTIVSYISCLILGLPLVLLLKKYGSLNTIFLTICGAVLGAIVFHIVGAGFSAIIDSTINLFQLDTRLLKFGAGFGVLVSIPYGVIAGFPIIGKAR
jgi:hypothetical protein